MSKADQDGDSREDRELPAQASDHRPIRSFVIRSGRLTHSQRRSINCFWQDFGINYQAELVKLEKFFPNPAKLVVEIGFGMGDSLLQMATENPQLNFIGIEVHKPGVGKLLQGLADRQLTNVKIISHDAREVLERSFTNQSIDKIQVFFPDPWPKKRHHKRRLIQAEFVRLLTLKLKPEGQVHLATDWQEYAEHMLETLTAEPLLYNTAGSAGYLQQKQRPTTKFERRGQRCGHGVWDLLFSKGSA